MKLSELQNGWELIESMNNEIRLADGIVGEIQDHNRRRAAMQFMQHKLLKEDETTDPQTGIFFWVPIIGSKITWRLETFFDSQFPVNSEHSQGLDHQGIWLRWANTILGKDDSDAPREIRHHYSGLPRGRVTVTKERKYTGAPATKVWLILNGGDAPMPEAKAGKLLASRFYLPDGQWKYVFDDHERMLADDVKAIQRYLGHDLGLLKKVAKFD